MNIKKIEKANKALSILRICLVIVLLILIGCNIVHEWIGVTYNLFEFEVEADFKKHIGDFDTLAKTFSQRFKNECKKNEALEKMTFKGYDGRLYIDFIYKDGESYKSIDRDEPLDKKLELCFDSLQKNVFTRRYDSHKIGFYQIVVDKEEVRFLTDSTYFIVYSKKRPSYPYKGYGNYRNDFVDRIGFNWYQVISDYGGVGLL